MGYDVVLQSRDSPHEHIIINVLYASSFSLLSPSRTPDGRHNEWKAVQSGEILPLSPRAPFPVGLSAMPSHTELEISY